MDRIFTNWEFVPNQKQLGAYFDSNTEPCVSYFATVFESKYDGEFAGSVRRSVSCGNASSYESVDLPKSKTLLEAIDRANRMASIMMESETEFQLTCQSMENGINKVIGINN